MLRPATTADLDVVASWIASRRDCEVWAGPALHFPLQRSTLARDIGLSPDTSFCMGDDGIAAFGQLLDRGSGRSHLARIIVAPAQRRSGCGTRLVGALLDLAAARGHLVAGLNVRRDNLAALALYRKLGFEVVARPAGSDPAAGAEYMARTLAAAPTRGRRWL